VEVEAARLASRHGFLGVGAVSSLQAATPCGPGLATSHLPAALGPVEQLVYLRDRRTAERRDVTAAHDGVIQAAGAREPLRCHSLTRAGRACARIDPHTLVMSLLTAYARHARPEDMHAAACEQPQHGHAGGPISRAWYMDVEALLTWAVLCY